MENCSKKHAGSCWSTACFFQQFPVRDPGGADTFTGPAVEASIQRRDHILVEFQLTFPESPHQVKPAPWRVLFVPEFTVGGAVVQAEAAVNALQDVIEFCSPKLLGQFRCHPFRS